MNYLKRWLPGLQTLKEYQMAWLPHDLMAGLVLTTMLVRHPNATFSRTDESLALADVLKNEASQLDSARCDPKGAKLLRNAVDAAEYGGGR